MKKDGTEEGRPVPRPEWPSVRCDYRQIYGFNSGMFEPGQFLELTAPGSSGEWT